MKRKFIATTAALAAIVLGATVLATGPLSAHGSGDDDRYGRHMGSGMMGQGYGTMGPGMGYGMGYGMMGPGMGYGMGTGMHPGMMGPGMGYGMGYGMGPCGTAESDRELGVDDVTKMLQFRLDHMGNPRLKLGKVEVKDDDTIVAEIVTRDGALVDKLAIDRDTGRQKRVE